MLSFCLHFTINNSFAELIFFIQIDIYMNITCTKSFDKILWIGKKIGILLTLCRNKFPTWHVYTGTAVLEERRTLISGVRCEYALKNNDK